MGYCFQIEGMTQDEPERKQKMKTTDDGKPEKHITLSNGGTTFNPEYVKWAQVNIKDKPAPVLSLFFKSQYEWLKSGR